MYSLFIKLMVCFSILSSLTTVTEAGVVKKCSYNLSNRCKVLQVTPEEAIIYLNSLNPDYMNAYLGNKHLDGLLLKVRLGKGFLPGYERVRGSIDNTYIMATGKGYVGYDRKKFFTARCEKEPVVFEKTIDISGYTRIASFYFHHCEADEIQFTVVSKDKPWGTMFDFFEGHVD